MGGSIYQQLVNIDNSLLKLVEKEPVNVTQTILNTPEPNTPIRREA